VDVNSGCALQTEAGLHKFVEAFRPIRRNGANEARSSPDIGYGRAATIQGVFHMARRRLAAKSKRNDPRPSGRLYLVALNRATARRGRKGARVPLVPAGAWKIACRMIFVFGRTQAAHLDPSGMSSY